MKVMILAAGRGKRMGALTDKKPKPLLTVGGKPLIERLIEQLAGCGLTELVINLAWRGEKIRGHIGDGSAWGVTVQWSNEGALPVGTAAGIRLALPLLGAQPFLLINSDVIADIDFPALVLAARQAEMAKATLLLVDNPDHNPQGDFSFAEGRLVNTGGERLTYAGCGVFDPGLVSSSTQIKLGPLILDAVSRGETIAARHHSGWWLDVGTPERLQLAEELIDRGCCGGKKNE